MFGLFFLFHTALGAEFLLDAKVPAAIAVDGRIVAQLYEDFSGSDGELEYKEALDFVRAVEVRLDAAPACGTSAAAKAKPHTCFAHTTPGDTIGASKAGRFAACIVGHKSSACRATLCA